MLETYSSCFLHKTYIYNRNEVYYRLNFIFLYQSIASAGVVEALLKELPIGSYVGESGCKVQVRLVADSEPRYEVEVSKPEKITTIFTITNHDTLTNIEYALPQYVGNPDAEFNIRTNLMVARTNTKIRPNSFQIMISSTGKWIIRTGSTGSVSCHLNLNSIHP